MSIRDMIVFSLLGTVMFCSKIIMEVLPNIHLLGMLTMTYTVVFGKRALIPIYIYVMLNGLYGGFNMWWVPYLYIWTILWAVTMPLRGRMSKEVQYVVYPIVCFLHGILFGVLYAPAQALMFGMDFKMTVAWILAGLPFDVIHGISNLFVGMLVVPMSELISRLVKKNGMSA